MQFNSQREKALVLAYISRKEIEKAHKTYSAKANQKSLTNHKSRAM